ncbi:chromophore lyase CpcT/CpeT [Nostoc sp. MS1]|uniref:chromophore lyase CpcT/CpeT n=1 Tax=Nostoc sp. MS1 TaxID=2764711 RepID=UPI001CC6FA9E|nr:chromophore lyase CpcT/CpeT [Nostoc sp. MS1]BCL37675.1 hypothetical protein NSMS1_41220 [Nostoc sp. MS1]
MNINKAYTLTALIPVLTIAPVTRVNAISAPPLKTQVKQVAQWFTGLFDNSQQVANNPSIPLITLSSCSVDLTNANPTSEIENIYLEQKSINRFRLYSFSPGTSSVNLSIRSFESSSLYSGLCNRPQSQQIIDYSQVLQTSCELNLFWQQNSYIGNNAPNGCPTSSNGKVVSSVTIFPNSINSLDQIFASNGKLLFATPVEFRRIAPIPEPSLIIGLLVVSLWGSAKAISRRHN